MGMQQPVRNSIKPGKLVSLRGYNECYAYSMKTAISIPDRVFRSAEQLAERLGVSRSELYSKALAALVDEHQDNLITSRLSEIYGPGREDSSLDPELALLQQRTLSRGKR